MESVKGENITIKYAHINDRIVEVMITGILNIETHDLLRQFLQNLMSKGYEHFIINVLKLERISSSGIYCFLDIVKKTGRKDAVRFMNVSDSLRNVLDVLQLSSLFGDFNTQEEAIKSLKI